MCYDKAYLTRKRQQYARRYSHGPDDEEFIRQLNELHLGPVYHASGFDHPAVPVIINGSDKLQLYTWGLIPSWIKSAVEAVTISNSTINARAETMFEKPAFREPARSQRCLVLIDGFFEHHHKNGKTFPYHIRLRNDEPMTLAGLWDEWVDRESGLVRRTYTVVTTRANALMARIHNNPKLEEGPRMPLILPKELEREWLKPINTQVDQGMIISLVRSYPDEMLEAFTVRHLRGKEAVGNTPEALAPHRYQIMEEQQGSLF